MIGLGCWQMVIQFDINFPKVYAIRYLDFAGSRSDRDQGPVLQWIFVV